MIVLENNKFHIIESVFHSKLNEYKALIDAHSLAYTESALYFEVGKCVPNNKWIFFISVIKYQAPELLSLVLPVLRNDNVPFRIVKNPLIHHFINIGRYGNSQLGKVLTVYPESESQAIYLIKLLMPMLSCFQGPDIIDTTKIGPSLFGSFSKTIIKKIGAVKSSNIKKNDIPFVGNCLLAKPIKVSPKGNIYKAIWLKRFSFTSCIIKEGRLNMVDDYYGRTIRDRLLWQMKVLNQLYDKIRIPKILSFFERKGNSYLVMEKVKGIPLQNKIEPIYRNKKWNELSAFSKYELLIYYIKSLQIIEAIHQNGFVHRDIKHDNFMVLPTGEPLILDFELSYSVVNAEPTIPFNTINPTYQAPEQLNNDCPTIKEDIYACGCLLVYLLTGYPPALLMRKKNYGIVKKLEILKIDTSLINIISICLNNDPLKRPHVNQIIIEVKSYIHSTIIKTPEKPVSSQFKISL